ncbi:hypothetical protein TGME49_310122 [Toxoplasma gondii ME49]|uniref:Uncharacterized protein n=3 Tax=Toxoplasma gondii TaxID=5811 RepID=A0A125YX52_TOXGV|nr:hypothetical protein TGME49_310122 [Toxoplasma gondii ME49]EPT26223.1 hypothetical protein TGME49_310122 [Toxoplasma gondii ME49]ESS34828.1 hypothetical protein TGVEG_310122 [Toxoplasma gondii VEG]KYF47561.1 hypothetical protein TGARI_310122 [Toxoplasma gondii ARI]|eukprot:XP_018635587.1 hypothetical protein TGME49_310122 [Toxoplasma gondii ME49]
MHNLFRNGENREKIRHHSTPRFPDKVVQRIHLRQARGSRAAHRRRDASLGLLSLFKDCPKRSRPSEHGQQARWLTRSLLFLSVPLWLKKTWISAQPPATRVERVRCETPRGLRRRCLFSAVVCPRLRVRLPLGTPASVASSRFAPSLSFAGAAAYSLASLFLLAASPRDLTLTFPSGPLERLRPTRRNAACLLLFILLPRLLPRLLLLCRLLLSLESRQGQSSATLLRKKEFARAPAITQRRRGRGEVSPITSLSSSRVSLSTPQM